MGVDGEAAEVEAEAEVDVVEVEVEARVAVAVAVDEIAGWAVEVAGWGVEVTGFVVEVVPGFDDVIVGWVVVVASLVVDVASLVVVVAALVDGLGKGNHQSGIHDFPTSCGNSGCNGPAAAQQASSAATKNVYSRINMMRDAKWGEIFIYKIK